MFRSHLKKTILTIALPAILLTTGCGNLGGLGGLLGGGGPAFLNSPWFAILNIGSQLVISGIQNAPNPIDAELTGESAPQAPFKILFKTDYNPLLNGTLLTGLIDQPMAGAIGPDGKLYFTEKETGRVRRLDLNNPANPEIVLDLPVNFTENRGLIGICFSPNGVTPALMYLTYVRSTTDADTSEESEALESRVSTFPVDNLTAGAEAVLFAFSPRDPGALAIPFAANGIGTCSIGPDQKLYFTHGDWGTRLGAQDTSPDNPAGKIHRVNLDGSIPGDNPFPGNSAYAWGFRFPTAVAWDSADNQMWMAERGFLVSDELNIVNAGSNYGYPMVQGISNTSWEQILSLFGIAYKEPQLDFSATKPNPGLSSIAIIRSSVYPDGAQGDILYAHPNLRQTIPIIGESLSRVGRLHYPKDPIDLVVNYGDAWVAPVEAGAVYGLVTLPDGHVVALCRNGIYRLDVPPPTP